MELGVGLIGTGYMGKCHALAWNAVGPVFGTKIRPRLVHLADATDTLAKDHAAAFGFEKATHNWRDLIADPDVAIVSITTPNQFHAEMAVAALEAGKHVWCEKPMAPAFKDAMRMRDAANASGKVAALGYNYIQNPAIRHIKRLLDDGTIGDVYAIRLEMDEDFLADPALLFGHKNQSASGYGALDDFGVHPLSLIATLFGNLEAVMADLSKPYAARIDADGRPQAVETHDCANVLIRLKSGISGTIQLSRTAWGRKGRIALQIFASKGTVTYDQERMNEFQIYIAEGPAADQGFRTILTGPVHPPYDRFIPAPGHGLGFNELKIIEANEILNAIDGRPAHLIDFAAGLEIERAVHAMAHSHKEGHWVSV
ncbi:Gfo/Idh/MocA family protein [Pelagibacterium lentulum]|uniref:Myo-inositol 2-dehydrogenase n=1 Tax=Pelagibacterium lentulum TaxID=2029865 RepID=A0A916W2V6_9HYPH|nr:Gfo/Idh/MocA family oxidoreductase [Pelagibacterium lentulum]GGA63019.1 myo-inositol 2-dehydrogenase [Pelagibacterium lentulum]